jgi:hypothetical protein
VGRFNARAHLSVQFPVEFLTRLVTVDHFFARTAAHLSKVPVAGLARVGVFEISDLDEKVLVRLSYPPIY